jgi:hypothetical protein
MSSRHRPVRPPVETHFAWSKLSSFFPLLTHLSLPCLVVHHSESINVPPNQLVKLDLGRDSGLPAIPIQVATRIIRDNYKTLKHISMVTPDFHYVDECAVLQGWIDECLLLEGLSLCWEVAMPLRKNPDTGVAGSFFQAVPRSLKVSHSRSDPSFELWGRYTY